MSAKLFLEYADITCTVLGILVLLVMWRRKHLSAFSTLGYYIASLIVLGLFQVPLLFHRKALGIDLNHAWSVFFYSTQTLTAIQAALILATIYSVFHEAMRPFKGLQRMGAVVFKWVTAVSVLLGAVIAFGPHMLSSGSASIIAVTTVIGRAQEGINVLTLCLLLFVCVAIKPLGLTFRSHVFGVTLGLGIISTTDLVQAAWFWTTGAHSVYSPVYLFGTIGYIVAISMWGIYLAIPEPERKMILLPTTSPFFHWNRISEALGDSPGHVAIGFKPSMISPVEVKMMTAMSKAKRERESAASDAEAQAESVVEKAAVS